MKHRRIAMVGAGALAIASLALTACSSTSNAGSPAASSAQSPSVALAAAMTGISGKGYDMTLTADGVTGTGSVDPADHAVTLDAKGTVEGQSLELVVTEIGTDLWAKVDLGSLNSQVGLDPTKWMKVDASKVDSSTIGLDLANVSDALDIGSMAKAVTSVKRTDATHLSGTIDLTKFTGASGPNSTDVDKAGAAAKSVPFTATLDGKGQLAEVKIDGHSAGTGLSVDIKLSNVGSPTAISAPPAADVIPAPAAIYQFLGSN